MAKTYIIGHRKPDTDAVVAAMALEFLYKELACMGNNNPEAVIIDPLNPETKFIFDKLGVTPPRLITASDIGPEDKIVLVDHNEENQRLEGINPEQIVEILDHHKVNLNLSQPIFMNFKAWGSSSTIIYFMMKTMGINPVKPNKILASLMLAAILSDTVGYKSATTTPKDIKMGKELAEIAEITDIDSFTLEIFKAKSDISGLSNEEIVTNDYKIFEFGKKDAVQKTFIDQLETVEQNAVLTDKKQDLLEAMIQVKKEQEVDLLFVAITDILKVNTKLIILGEAEQKVAEAAFGGKVEDNILDIGPKMSRKKQIAPAIEKALL